MVKRRLVQVAVLDGGWTGSAFLRARENER